MSSPPRGAGDTERPGCWVSRWTKTPSPSHRAGKYRFRLKASNGQVVASGEAYETRAAAVKGCESVQRAAEGAPIVETEG
ncbi:YegP family protein [Pseudonocardia sichuanensis]